MQVEVVEDIRTIFNAPDHAIVEAYLAETVAKYQPSASLLSEWLAVNIPEGLTVFSFPGAFRRLLRTTNGVERLHREVRRRARVVSILSQSGLLPASGHRHTQRDQRRMAHRQNIFDFSRFSLT
jgi:transposase-like protein